MGLSSMRSLHAGLKSAYKKLEPWLEKAASDDAGYLIAYRSYDGQPRHNLTTYFGSGLDGVTASAASICEFPKIIREPVRSAVLRNVDYAPLRNKRLSFLSMSRLAGSWKARAYMEFSGSDSDDVAFLVDNVLRTGKESKSFISGGGVFDEQPTGDVCISLELHTTFSLQPYCLPEMSYEITPSDINLSAPAKNGGDRDTILRALNEYYGDVQSALSDFSWSSQKLRPENINASNCFRLLVEHNKYGAAQISVSSPPIATKSRLYDANVDDIFSYLNALRVRALRVIENESIDGGNLLCALSNIQNV